jgi:hypothetical protein
MGKNRGSTFNKKDVGAYIAILIVVFMVVDPGYGQSAGKSQINNQTGLHPYITDTVMKPNPGSGYSDERSSMSEFGFAVADDDSMDSKLFRKTTSLTAGYISDVFSIQDTDGSYRFRFDGETTGLMLSSRSSLLMLSHGFADARENEGEIRSMTADLQLGGNITVFNRFLGLPLRAYLPVRFNFGYRNLELIDDSDPDLNSTANIGSGSIGGGFGGELRIPTGLPVLKDNITAFAHLVTSVGAIGDVASYWGDPDPGDTVLGGIRLTKSSDLNIEVKFEKLLGDNTGLTAGMTVRRLHWTRKDAENAKQILDIISGREDGLDLRGTQTFFRVGINW